MAHDVNQSETDIAAQVQSALVARISSERFDLWIPPGTQWRWNGMTLHLDFESEFACQLAKRMLGKELTLALGEVAGADAELKWQVVAGMQPTPRLVCPPDRATENAPNRSVTKVAAAAEVVAEARGEIGSDSRNRPASRQNLRLAEHSLTSRESWERYMLAPSNQLAWTTANMVLGEPGRWSPVFFHGPCGVGKTHLAGALAQQLRGRCRLRRVVHMTSEQFTNDFTESIKGGGLPMFRRKYRDLDALLVEDVHFLIGKKSTLGELQHTLDTLLRGGKQVVLTSDRPLNDLQALGSDIIGRLRSGLLSPISPLDEPLRSSLLGREMAEAGVEIAEDILHQIASRCVGDGRVLQGIAKRLAAVASLSGERLTWEDCWNAVFDLVQSTHPVVRLCDIERVVCEVFGLQPTSLQSQSKARTIAQPRMLAMFLARKYTPAAYKEIGEYFGQRRHSTVISAEKTVEEWLRDNTNFGDSRGMSVRDAIRHVEAHLQVG